MLKIKIFFLFFIFISSCFSLNDNQIKPIVTINIPDGLAEHLLSLPIEQVDYNECTEIKDEDNHFHMNTSLPQPDFFVVGLDYPNAGEIITALYKHPRIHKTENIDPSFFSFPSSSSIEYQKNFLNEDPGPRNAYLLGDYSYSYIYHPLTPKRIAAAFFNPKVIIILRNPIDRAYTTYLKSVAFMGETRSFEHIINAEFNDLETFRIASRSCFNENNCNITNCIPSGNITKHNGERKPISSLLEYRQYFRKSLLFRSLYDDMVERWLKSFLKKNVLVLFHEDFYYNFDATYEKIQTFLYLSDITNTDKITLVDEFEMEFDPINDETYDALVDFFAPFNDRLFNLINRADTDWKYHRSNLKKLNKG